MQRVSGGFLCPHTATPRSDIDLVLEVLPTLSRVERSELWEQAYAWFSQLPFAVDLFILDSSQLKRQRGLAAVVRREGTPLAMR